MLGGVAEGREILNPVLGGVEKPVQLGLPAPAVSLAEYVLQKGVTVFEQ